MFQMKNQSEVSENFQFLNKTVLTDNSPPTYNLEIKDMKKTLIKFSSHSIAEIQKVKNEVYNVLITKQEESMNNN